MVHVFSIILTIKKSYLEKANKLCNVFTINLIVVGAHLGGEQYFDDSPLLQHEAMEP